MATTKIVFLILPHVHLLDLAGPDQVFLEAKDYGEEHWGSASRGLMILMTRSTMLRRTPTTPLSIILFHRRTAQLRLNSAAPVTITIRPQALAISIT